MPRSALFRPRVVLAATLGSAVALTVAVPSHAITSGGTPTDEGIYRSVAGLVPVEGFSRVTCSGTLVSSTVVLMAAHCEESVRLRSEGTDRGFVTFDAEYVHGQSTLLPGRIVSHPAYDKAMSEPNDLAVFLLDQPVTDRKPVALRAQGSLGANSDLRGTTYTVAGYGTEELGAGQVRQGNNVREFARSLYRTHTDALLKLDQNQATGNEGTCYADSGGPVFDAAGTQVAVTISGDTMCKATGVYQRLDTPAAQAFLREYVTP